MRIEDIENPKFLKSLNSKQLRMLCSNIRGFLVDSISKTGGHLSSNLGIVEVSVALLKVFNDENDQIIYDVGHQSYVHKILTGRANKFGSLRQYGGISGFQKRKESSYDAWEAGHSSTSISAALGAAIARDKLGQDHNIVAVIGDGALGGGMALEALNHLSDLNTKVIIVLNDNEMSISKPIGGINHILSSLRMSKLYLSSKRDLKSVLSRDYVGEHILNGLKNFRNSLKHVLIDSNIFMDIGIDYLGPIDGHNVDELIQAFELAKHHDGSILIHVITQKGKGYSFAENDDNGKWHGVQPFDVSSGKSLTKTNDEMISYSEVVGDYLCGKKAIDNRLVVLTPAMISGSKLNKFFELYPDSSYDCGIAEEHTLTLSASLAANGLHPFVSVYSSFLQRAYDQVNHDLARMDLNVVVGVDRAGLVGEDGETHHGVFDIAFLRSIPNVTICEGKDADELIALLDLGFKNGGPFFVRYPRGSVKKPTGKKEIIEVGTFTTLKEAESPKLVVFSYGEALNALSNVLADYPEVELINARFFKPLDEQMLLEKSAVKNWLVYEDDCKIGGLSSAICEFACDHQLDVKISRMGIEDHYVTHGNVKKLLEVENLDMRALRLKVEEILNGKIR